MSRLPFSPRAEGMHRHDLCYLRRGCDFRFLCAEPGHGLSAIVAAWIADERPLVVSRQGARAEQVQLALTLPARLGRQRLACLVNREDVLLTRPPLAVGDCLPRLEMHARTVLADLDATLLASGVQLGVFGSLAWEVLSGESYRHAESDIDLICDLRSHRQLDDSLHALRVASARMTCRLDGELRFPGGDAVAWRELAACRHRPTAQVLVKGLYEVELKPVAALLDSLLAEPAHA